MKVETKEPKNRLSDDECLLALEQQGLLTVGAKKLPAFEPLAPHGKKLLSEMVIEDRE